MALVLEDAKAMLRTIIRSIDKKADYSVSLVDGDRPGVAVSLSARKRNTTVSIPAEDLEAARHDSMRRSQLRTTLKRALDRMAFQPMPVADTKMLRATMTEGGFFRPAQGGRGRR
jgi:hypothetical protein